MSAADTKKHKSSCLVLRWSWSAAVTGSRRLYTGSSITGRRPCWLFLLGAMTWCGVGRWLLAIIALCRTCMCITSYSSAAFLALVRLMAVEASDLYRIAMAFSAIHYAFKNVNSFRAAFRAPPSKTFFYQ